jgi:L-2-amino-thiazoline-4-carboxylic acid hydrolase-like protein
MKDFTMSGLHPFYEAHRPAMEEAMRQRLDLADPLLREHLRLSDSAELRQQIMDEFQIVLEQMPYVGGAESRMSDFFMRLLGFMAIGRVLSRHGLPAKVISDIEVETYKAQLMLAPETDRLKAGRQFMSAENKAMIREQAALSHEQKYPGDFVYDFVEPGPGDRFEFGINYRACGFCKFAAEHGDKDILPNICGLDFVAYETRGIKLERTQTLAGGATHCNFRFTSMPSAGPPET